MGQFTVQSSSAEVSSSTIGGQLLQILMADDIQPGSDLSYQLAKAIYLYHPLGQKMAEAPISMAQSQERKITVQDAPEEVVREFEIEWNKINADAHIHNASKLARIYGISSLVVGCEQVTPGEPLDMTKIWEQDLWFNALDPLNTAGSLVLSQVPTASDFNKPVIVRVNGQVYHRSRYQVVMNEAPVYLAFTTSAFGFVGRSVYQRALYPLKSFIRSMIADDMIATKLGLIVAKQKAPGSIISKAMEAVAGIKRALLKQAQTGQVLSIDVEEEVETLDMQNVDGAGTYSRDNILKNIATAADMPAKLLQNESFVEGFGEGTEDSKNVARYIETVRRRMQPLYAFFDNIVQYRVWNPDFYKRIQRLYPEHFGSVEYAVAFNEWRQKFQPQWPSQILEPESDRVKVEETKLNGLVDVMTVLMPEMDPENKAKLIEWCAQNCGENKLMFPYALTLDLDALKEHQEDKNEREANESEAGIEATKNKAQVGGPAVRKVGSQRKTAA